MAPGTLIRFNRVSKWTEIPSARLRPRQGRIDVEGEPDLREIEQVTRTRSGSIVVNERRVLAVAAPK